MPDADGLVYWIDQMNAGVKPDAIAATFYSAGVQYGTVTGYSTTMSDADFVNVVYRNVLGRSAGADAGGLDYWTGQLASGAATRGSLVSTILDSAHTYKGNAEWGWVANLLDNKILTSKSFALDFGLGYAAPEASITQGVMIAAAVTPAAPANVLSLVGITAADFAIA